MFGIQPPASLKFSVPTDNLENEVKAKHNHYSNPNSPLYNPLTPDLTRLNISTAEFIIVSAFGGTEYPFDFCHDFSTALEKSSISVSNHIIEFISAKDGPCSLIMEKHACKVFHCTIGDLNNVNLDKTNINKLKRLWSFLQETVLPNVISLLHPLAEKFNIKERKILYTHFRNKVCLRILKNNRRKIKSLCGIVKILLYETENDSILYDEFCRMASILIDGGDDFTLSECSNDTIRSNISICPPDFNDIMKEANDSILIRFYTPIERKNNKEEKRCITDDIFEMISREVSI
uniref:Uncharacterized protein n=1 Tax=Parastrongyloides trichosuri TaxID=131310 RepID=A0A0N5A1T0_PARTI